MCKVCVVVVVSAVFIVLPSICVFAVVSISISALSDQIILTNRCKESVKYLTLAITEKLIFCVCIIELLLLLILTL